MALQPMLLLLCLASVAMETSATSGGDGGCGGGRVRFLQLAGCPTETDKAQMRASGDAAAADTAASCLMMCAADANCSAAHFSPEAEGGGGACYRSRLAAPPPPAWPAAAAPAPASASASGHTCQSFARRPSLPAHLAILCWFSFPYGLSNLADGHAASPVCASTAVCVGAACNATGAVLSGSRQSRVEIGVAGDSGLEGHLPSGQEFSVFVKAWRRPSTTSYTHYFRLTSSSDFNSLKGLMFETFDRQFQMVFDLADFVKFGTSSSPAPSESTVVSVGMSYSPSSGYQLFVQDSMVNMVSMTPSGPASLPGNLILLGYSQAGDAHCLTGTILCFAISNRSLSVDQFRTLRDGC